MNHREPPQPTAAVRQATLWLAALLLPVFAPARAHAARRPASDPNAYLPTVAAPALRFQPAALPREQVAKLIFPKPAPKPAAKSAANAIPPAEAAARPAPAIAGEPKEPATAEPTAPKPAQPAARPPQQILRDDIRPTLHPEDFIPFFQLPGAPGLNVIVPVPRPPSAPVPAPLPESSATLRQTP